MFKHPDPIPKEKTEASPKVLSSVRGIGARLLGHRLLQNVPMSRTLMPSGNRTGGRE